MYLQELHDLDQAVVVPFLDLLHQTLVSLLDEVVQVGQALDDVVDQMLLEGEAPPLDVVQQSHLERLHVGAEPVLGGRGKEVNVKQPILRSIHSLVFTSP